MKKQTPPELDEFEAEIYELSKERLAITDHDVLKWQCCVQGCEHFNRVKDYGIGPYYRWRGGWIDLRRHTYYCGKHWRIYKAGQERSLSFKLGAGIHHLKPNE